MTQALPGNVLKLREQPVNTVLPNSCHENLALPVMTQALPSNVLKLREQPINTVLPASPSDVTAKGQHLIVIRDNWGDNCREITDWQIVRPPPAGTRRL